MIFENVLIMGHRAKYKDIVFSLLLELNLNFCFRHYYNERIFNL